MKVAAQFTTKELRMLIEAVEHLADSEINEDRDNLLHDLESLLAMEEEMAGV